MPPQQYPPVPRTVGKYIFLMFTKCNIMYSTSNACGQTMLLLLSYDECECIHK